MPRNDRSRADLTITPSGGSPIYLTLARADQVRGTGYRAYQRTKPERVTPRQQFPGVMPGSRDGEVGQFWNNDPASGWGDGRYRGQASVAYSRNVCYRFPGMAFLGPLVSESATWRTSDVAPRVFWEHPNNSTHVYVAMGNTVGRFDPASPSGIALGAAGVLTLSANEVITQTAPMDGYVWIATYNTSTGSPGKLYRHACSGTTDTFSSTDATASAIALGSKSTGLLLYRVYESGGLTYISTILSGNDARSEANWGTGENISVAFANNGMKCRWLYVYGGQVFAAMADGVYSFDENLVFQNVARDLERYQSSTNGLGMFEWHGRLAIPHLRGIFAYDGNGITDVSPTTATTLRTDADGRRFGLPTSGLMADSDYLYCPLWNGTDTYLAIGQQRGGSLTWTVGEVYLAGKGPFTAGWVTGKTDPPTAFLLSTNRLAWWTLPDADNPLQDPRGFAASGTLYHSAYDMGMPVVAGTFNRLVTEADSLTTTEKITPSYRMGETGSFTSLTAITSSPNTQYPSGPPNGVSVQVANAFARGNTTTLTPILRGHFAEMTKQPEQAVVWEITAALDNGPSRGQRADDVRAALSAIEASTTPLSVEDPWGGTFTGLLDGAVQYREAAQQGTEPAALLANLRLVQVQS